MEDALLIGLSEDQYYGMSLAEFERFVDSFKRRLDLQRQRDYANANLLSYGIAGRLQGNGFTFPSYEELYGNENHSEELSIEQSKANFMKFAQARNLKYGGNK